MSEFINLFVKTQSEIWELSKKIENIDKICHERMDEIERMQDDLRDNIRELKNEKCKLLSQIDQMKTMMRLGGKPDG